MIRRTLVSCMAGALALFFVLTLAVPQAQVPGGPIADLQTRVQALEQAPLASYDQLAGLPCTTAFNETGTVKLVGLFKTSLFKTSVCADGRFLDLGPAVFDTQTKLMWEKKTTPVGSGHNFADLHDVDNTYTWSTAMGDWIAAVNAEVFAGFSNWRVPMKDELLTIVDTSVAMCGLVTPCIDPIFGPTQASDYWSSTEVGPNVAWIVIFSSGNLRFGNKNADVHVRAVRSGP